MNAPAAFRATKRKQRALVPVAARIDQWSIPVTECGCIIWLGNLDGGGYGTIRMDGKMVKAHRASWICQNGTIPDGMMVLHRCDMPLCINPDHLFLGTQSDNMQDMARKGRSNSAGENNGRATITADTARQIRAASGTYNEIARQFGIGKSMVGYIKNNKHWVRS